MEKDLQSGMKDLTGEEFQRELNRWFEDHGIIADLRSHLRHLMITALQDTHIGLKPCHNISPKKQALNLLVAEYLLSQGCHYTLSVFTSEVPSLGAFSGFSPGSVLKNRGSHKDLGFGDRKRLHLTKEESKSFFHESEVEELLNALGLSPCVEQIHLVSRDYLGVEEPLLECLLRIVPELATKLQIRSSLLSCQSDSNHKGVSQQWASEVVDVLLASRIKPHQVSTIQEAIFRITENEISRIAEEANKKQVQVLVERETRIQRILKEHEDEMISRLNEAEEGLRCRRQAIDEELTQRHRHLSKMALEWKNRHEEIIRLSKNLQSIQTENKSLKSTIDQLEGDNEDLRSRLQVQNGTIAELQNEISNLMKQVQNFTEINANLTERVQRSEIIQAPPIPPPPHNFQHKQVRSEEDSDKMAAADETLATNLIRDPTQPSDQNLLVSQPQFQEETKNKLGIRCDDNKIQESDVIHSNTANWDFSDDDQKKGSISSSDVSIQEEVVAEAWKRFRILEEESSRVDKSYLHYKMKYCAPVTSESESSKKAPDTPEVTPPPKVFQPKSPVELKVDDVLQDSNSLPETHINIPSFSGKENFAIRRSPILPRNEIKSEFFPKKESEKSHPIRRKADTNVIPQVTPRQMPTKRQLENHSYFMKSRSILQALQENTSLINDSTSSSNTESVLQSSSSNESSSVAKKHVSFSKESTKRSFDPVLLTPLRTASFYCKADGDSTETILKDSSALREDSGLQKPSVDPDMDNLKLLDKTKILPTKSLRQQILLTESEDDAKSDSPKNKINKSPLSDSPASPKALSVSSVSVSAGKPSASDDDFWG